MDPDGSARQADSLFALGRRQELLDLLHRQEARLERLQAPVLRGRYYLRLGRTYSFQGRREEAVDSLQHALREAQGSQDVGTLGEAQIVLAWEDYFAGRLSQAVERCQQAVKMLERRELSSLLTYAYFNLSLSYYFIGDFGRALETGAQSESLGATVGNRVRQSAAAALMGWSYAARGDGEEGIEAGQRALSYAPRAFDTAFAMGILGYAHLETGNLAEATSFLEQAVEHANHYRSKQVQNWFKTYLNA